MDEECSPGASLESSTSSWNAGRASRYTRSRLPVELAWSQAQPDRGTAMREEVRIKQLSRAEKLALVDRAAARGR